MKESLRQAALRVDRVGSVTVFWIFSVVILSTLFLAGAREEAVLFLVSLIANSLIVALLKITLRIPRPEGRHINPSGHAFPSGHAASATFLAIMVPYVLDPLVSSGTARAIQAALVLIAAVVAVSRVVLRAHTTLQVAAGIMLGVLIPLEIILIQDSILAFFF